MTRTKKFKLSAIILTILSFVLSFGPLCTYLVLAFNNASATASDKITLMSLCSVAVILSVVCLVAKYTPRCRLWLVLIGLYLCIDHFMGCILILAITQCVDELIVCPLAKYYRSKYNINREIDKRE